MDRARASTLWTNPDFVKLWAGQTVSKFGTHISGAAMAATAVLVLQATPAQMGLLGAFAGLPVLVISLLAGVWVDRLQRKPILITARSEEHTSELQSQSNLVCRLLLEKKKKKKKKKTKT